MLQLNILTWALFTGALFSRIMKEPMPPCLDCPDRTVGCHATCEKYKKYKDDHMKWAIPIAEQKLNSYEMNDLSRKRFEKWNKAKAKGNVK